MFGKNVSRPIGHHLDGRVIDVQEIFPTIQGEGPHAGLPAVFVRLFGCHLKCSFCDTDFESNTHPSMILEEITDRVRAVAENAGMHDKPLVVLTGGEPMRQNILPLIRELINIGHDVQIETAGTLWLDFNEIDPQCDLARLSFVVSPKTAKVQDAFDDCANAWKYICVAGLLDEEDGLPVMKTQEGGQIARLARPPKWWLPRNVYLQPCDVGKAQENKANLQACIESCMRFGYRLSLQQHKIIGLP